MQRKFVWALVVLVIAGVGSWVLYYTHAYDYIRNNFVSGPAPIPAPQDAQQYPGTAVPITTSTTTTTTYGTLTYITPVKVTAITPASITVQISGTQTKSFAISGDIPVYSTVLKGEAGKGLGDISVGSTISVYWSEDDLDTAVLLSFPRDVALSLTPEDNTHIVSGRITAISSSAVTIADPNAAYPDVTIALDAATKIATTVVAGQVGRDPKVGDYIVARGVSTTDIKTAKALVLPPSF